MTLAEELFRSALHLTAPWIISSLKFNEGDKRLDICVDFPEGSKFPCPECNTLDCPVHDTNKRTWRHLDFFEHQTYLHGRIPRITCPHCGVRQVNVPWAREKSGFTLLMEALFVLFAQTMQISQIAEKFKVRDKQIWRIIDHYVKEAIKKSDFSEISSIGVDETSRRKGHEYISVFADLDTGRIIHICLGKDSSTINSFADSLVTHNGSLEQIHNFCCDMSPAFIKGITETFPKSSIIFDKFHIMKLVNEALDSVRRMEQSLNGFLKKTRMIWLKNPSSLTAKQLETLGTLKDMNMKTVRAYNLKLSLQGLWEVNDLESANAYFKKWYFWATHSRIHPMVEVAKTLKKHWEGIINYFNNRYTNGLLEGINSLIQALKVNARGYRNDENFMTMIYLRQGQLKFDLPT